MALASAEQAHAKGADTVTLQDDTPGGPTRMSVGGGARSRNRRIPQVWTRFRKSPTPRGPEPADGGPTVTAHAPRYSELRNALSFRLSSESRALNASRADSA